MDGKMKYDQPVQEQRRGLLGLGRGMHFGKAFDLLNAVENEQNEKRCLSDVPNFASVNSSVIWVFVTRLMFILFLRCEGLVNKVLFVPQAMRLQQADLWYRSSFDRSRSVETSQSSSLSSQHSLLAVEPAAQHGLSSLRYLFASQMASALLHMHLYFFCILIYKQKWSVISSKLYKQGVFKHPDMMTWCGAAIEKNPQYCFGSFLSFYKRRILLSPTHLTNVRSDSSHTFFILYFWWHIPTIFGNRLLHCNEWIKSNMFEQDWKEKISATLMQEAYWFYSCSLTIWDLSKYFKITNCAKVLLITFSLLRSRLVWESQLS